MPESGDEQRWAGLMARAQVGDEQSYRLLLEELGGAITSFLRSRLHFDSMLIEDCVQESLLAIHQARHTYGPGRPFRPWMFAIVRYRTIDVLRRARRPNSPDAHGVGELAEQSAVDAEIDGTRILGRLSPHHREALTLTKVLGLSVAEAARKAGISATAMKVRVHRAVGASRRLLEDDVS